MKLANPEDTRTMLQYKKSLARWSPMKAPAMGLRKRGRSFRKVKIETPKKARCQRQTKNIHSTPVGSGHSWTQTLEAAAVCGKHGITMELYRLRGDDVLL